MQIVCPNVNLPEWKELEQKLGKDRAMLAFFRHGGDIPTLDQAQTYLGRAKAAEAPTTPIQTGETINAPGTKQQTGSGQPELPRDTPRQEVQAVGEDVRQGEGRPDSGGRGDERGAPQKPVLTPEREPYIREAAQTPGVKYQYSVFRFGGGIPDAVQVDAIGADGKSHGSGTPAEFRAAGADVPDVPASVPQGRYSADEIKSIGGEAAPGIRPVVVDTEGNRHYGDTHDAIEAAMPEGATPHPEVGDQGRAFETGDGRILGREEAAQESGIPTTQEPGKLHSQDIQKAKGGFAFVSPNVGEMKFSDAVQALGSDAQKNLEARAKEVAPKADVKSAIGDWADGAENTVAVHMPEGDMNAIDKVAARLGLEANQKNVLRGVYDPNGTAILHRVEFPKGTTVEQARMAMDDAGLKYKTLVPSDGGVTGYVFDSDGSSTDGVLKLADHESKPDIYSDRVQGDFIGDPNWSSRDAAADDYRRRLGEAPPAQAGEGGPQQGSVRTGGAPDTGPEKGVGQPPNLAGERIADTIDRAIGSLQSLKIHQPGRAFAATPFSLAWDGALDVAITGLKTGKAAARVVAEAVSHFKARYPGATPAQINRLEAQINRYAGKPGATTPDPGLLSRSREKVADFVGAGKVREAMAYTRDVADNKAGNAGREEASKIGKMVDAQFGKTGSTIARSAEKKLARRALAFAVEAGGDDSALADFRNKIESGTVPVKQATQALEAIKFARAHLSQLKPIVERYNNIMDNQLASEQAAGFDTQKYRNYVMHVQEMGEGNPILDFFGQTEGRGEGGTAFRKVRDFATFADSIAAGKNPKSLDAVDLLQARVTRGQQMINRKAWVDGLKQFKDPSTGTSVVMDAPMKERSDGTKVPEAPRGYEIEYAGFMPLAVKKGYEGTFSALTDPSWWSKSPSRRAFLSANAAGKSLSLAIDTYHLGRLMAWNAVTRLNALGMLGGGAKLPEAWSHTKGLTLLDTAKSEIISDGLARGLHPAEIRRRLQQKAKLDLLIDNGANFGRVEDALHQEWIRNIPGVGKLNRFIFDKFQRGAMAEVGLIEYDRQRGMSGNKGLTDAQVARKVAKDINTRFGNLGRQGVLRSRTMQDIARMIVLAPQWNEGLIRSELGALGQGGKAVGKLVTGRGADVGLLARSVATMVLGQFVANQIINYGTRGHPTWDNPEEGLGAKLSAWVPDVMGNGPGFFLHPMSIGAEVLHLLESAYERTGSWDKAVDRFARSRLASLARPAWTYMTQTDTLGRPTGEHRIREAIRSADPLPFAARPIDPFQKNIMVGQAQKQLMQSAGIKTDNAPSFEQRIRQLAHEYNQQHGHAVDQQFNFSDYSDVDSALRVDDHNAALDAMMKLLQTRTEKQIHAAYARKKNAPFTGRVSSESAFKQTLNPEQRDAYTKARYEREKLANSAMQLLREAVQKRRLESDNR